MPHACLEEAIGACFSLALAMDPLVQGARGRGGAELLGRARPQIQAAAAGALVPGGGALDVEGEATPPPTPA